MCKKLLLAVLLLLFSVPAFAEEAADITDRCTITTFKTQSRYAAAFDRSYKTAYPLRRGGMLTFSADEPISGIWLQYDDTAAPCEIRVPSGSEWTTVAIAGDYLSCWYPLPEGTQHVQLINPGSGRVRLAEITLFGAGTRPRRAPSWHTLDKCDLMLLVAHPDDELLWFGGLLPTYAGHRRLDVQVAYLAPSSGMRKLELLDGLWHCGVTAYPAFLGMRDVQGTSLAMQYTLWNKSTVYAKIVRTIRQYRPEVLVTHDFAGEYGHGAHRACADAAAHVLSDAADASAYHKSSAEFGAWQVKKLYIHLYDGHPLQMDWQVPLPAFDGATSLTVATEALACHASQVKNGWTMERSLLYDNSLFGLYFSAVGDDVLKNDLMENIPLE